MSERVVRNNAYRWNATLERWEWWSNYRQFWSPSVAYMRGRDAAQPALVIDFAGTQHEPTGVYWL